MREINPREAEVRDHVEAAKSAAWSTQERQHWLTQVRDITDYLFPHAGPSQGERDARNAEARWKGIFDTVATEALSVCVAGTMTHAFPTGGRWRNLKVRGQKQGESGGELATWLEWLGGQMEDLHVQSNVYQGVATLVQDVYAFGQGLAIADLDPLYTIWLHHVPVGDYALAASARGQIDTMYREITMPLRNVVKRWGTERLPLSLQKAAGEGSKNWFQPVVICHAIEPRPEEHRQDIYAKAQGMPELSSEMEWRSVYWVRDSAKHEGLLSESGYPIFPVLAPRGGLLPGCVYGYGRGQMVLSHVRSLQHRHHNLSHLSSWQSNPATVMPTAAQGMPFGPGQIIYVDTPNPNAFATPVTPGGRADLALAEIQDIRRQIKAVMGSDTFALITSLEGGNIRQEHILALQREKMAILGPQMARMLDELSKPLVDITAAWMQAQGKMGDVPQELAATGGIIDVELNGILRQASMDSQRAANEQFGLGVMTMMQAFPEVRHKVAPFAMVNALHESTGADPKTLRSDADAGQAAQAEAQARAAADQMAMMESTAKTAGSLGSIDTSKPNGLSAVRELAQGGGE